MHIVKVAVKMMFVRFGAKKFLWGAVRYLAFLGPLATYLESLLLYLGEVVVVCQQNIDRLPADVVQCC